MKIETEGQTYMVDPRAFPGTDLLDSLSALSIEIDRIERRGIVKNLLAPRIRLFLKPCPSHQAPQTSVDPSSQLARSIHCLAREDSIR